MLFRSDLLLIVLLILLNGVFAMSELAVASSRKARLAAMEESCTMDIVAVKGAKNILLGGEGVFNTVVRGPGKVILQTMPISKVAELLTPFFTKNK